jgi:hypothetical protein
MADGDGLGCAQSRPIWTVADRLADTQDVGVIQASAGTAERSGGLAAGGGGRLDNRDQGLLPYRHPVDVMQAHMGRDEVKHVMPERSRVKPR